MSEMADMFIHDFSPIVVDKEGDRHIPENEVGRAVQELYSAHGWEGGQDQVQELPPAHHLNDLHFGEKKESPLSVCWHHEKDIKVPLSTINKQIMR